MLIKLCLKHVLKWRDFLYAVLLWSLLLVGCSKNQGPLVVEDLKLPRMVMATSDAKAISKQKGLARLGVKVITIGQDYLISIPSAILFFDEAPDLTWHAYAVLNKVVDFLQEFRKVAITVSSYSNVCQAPSREYALTAMRARVVADYLWSQCIDSRAIFTEGMGSDKPIIASSKGGDKSFNSRVEITFKEAI